MAMMMMKHSSGSSPFHHAVSRSAAELHCCSRWPPTVALTRRPAVRCWSLRGDSGGGGAGDGLVDEGMPVLRRRILEMKATAVATVTEQDEEFSGEALPEWEEEEYSVWETAAKECGGGRHHRGGSDGQLFHVLGGFLRSRPGVAVGIAVFLMFSLPTSVFFAGCTRLVVEWQRLLFNLTKC